ncbi:MAG: hypothetical protein M0O92_06150, partial [Acholeplasmataceae bacterium]|nr:hypothetical protein [Acholeplasmataceae bacterium]
FELPDEERHKIFRDLSEEEQDYLLQWDGETEREIAETIDRIKRSAEEQKEIDKIETEPSEAQKEAGNYPKAHIKRDGLDISIENAAGSERSGKDETGKEWKQTINHDYGYVKGTKGPDKDHVDVFIKPGSSEGGTVYVVNQVNPNTQEFDEPKCMMGFESEAEAKEAYLSNYEENWQGLGSITPMSMDVFKKWVYSKDAKKKSPVTVADLKKYEQVKPEPKKESTAKKTETIQREGFEQPSPEYSEDVIPKEDVPVIQIRKDEDKKPQQKMPGQGRKDMENRLGNIIGYSIIVADEKDLKESGTKEPVSQRDKRRERSYEDGKAIAKKLIDEIEDRNYAELVDRLSVLKNKGSRAAFTAYTGIKLPKTVSGTKSVIRTFVGKDVYNKHLESIKKKKEEAAQKQKQKAIEERNERLKEEKVTDNGRLTNNFDLIHRLVEDEGYTRLEEEKKGIATHYLIHNDEKERYYRFRKKDHGDLIKELLEKQFGEVEITPPGVRVATKKDLDHLFGKDLKPEEKEKGTNKPADQNVISLKQEEFNAKENTKENQADTKAIKETGRSVRTVTSTRGGSHPRRQAAVKRSQPDESYSVEYWQAQHLHNLNVSLYNALRFGWKDRKGKSHPGMQPGWINDYNMLTDSNILGGRRGKNLSSNAQFYLQDLVDSFNESPEYLAELASLGLEQPEHIDDIRMWLEQSLSASEFVEYHKGYEADLVPQTDMNKFNEALEVFQEDHTKLTPEQRRVLEESWQMDLDDVIARENALQEQPGSAIDEMWGEEKAEDLFEGTELAGPVTRSETSTKKKPQYETGDLFEGTALQETELGKELVRRREKKDKIKERGAEGLPLFETPDESNQTSLFEQGKESSEKYVQESAKIEDFGEKIGGARKDYYAD